jgi:pimeloyl-ACP methyl ester carboxylesterase
VRFCKSKDDQGLAWASVGDGPEIVKAPNWIGHLELDWRHPGLAHLFDSLSARRRLVYFDARGNGLSDWEMETISFDLMVDDLECVFNAASIDRAPILALSQGCAIAAAFAARAPERVSAIVMMGGFPVGRAKRKSKKDQERAKALQAMMTSGWDDEYPSLRDLIAETIIPGASREDQRRYAEDMRDMISPENLGRYREVIDNLDVTSLLPEVQTPCLVMHSKGDRMQPIEQGRKLAAGIRNARFIVYESNNHVLTENDPCWPLAEREIHTFLEAHR